VTGGEEETMKAREAFRLGGRVLAILLLTALVPAPAAAQSGKPWRHGILEAKSDAGIYMMVGEGFAQKFGVDLQIVQVQSDAIGLKALIAGELESYDGAVGGTAIAASHGVDVKLLGCHWPGLPHGIFARANINSVQDLRGKTFAISSPNSLPDVLAKRLLETYHIPESAVTFASLGSDVDRYKALVAGVVDATVISGEYEPIAAKEGIKLLVPGREVLPNYMRVCIFANGTALSQRREDAIHFMAAEMAGLRYALTHRDETLALTRKVTGAKPDDPRPAYIFDDAVRTKSVDPDISLPAEKIAWMKDELVREGSLPASFDMQKMIDPEIRAKALELVNK
jgi:NitT/TauT family transport system substrate-binding protein